MRRGSWNVTRNPSQVLVSALTCVDARGTTGNITDSIPAFTRSLVGCQASCCAEIVLSDAPANSQSAGAETKSRPGLLP